MTNSLRIKEDKMWIRNKQIELEFNNIKREIENIKHLNLPDFVKELILRTDAFNIGL